MPTLVIFIALAIILAILLAIIVLMPWLRADKSAQNDQLIALNVEVFKQRLDELKSDFELGQMSADEFKVQKTELERQLLLASEDKNQKPVDKGDANSQETNDSLARLKQELRFTQSPKARLTILICIPLLIIFAYALSANRTPVMQLWQAQDEVGQIADDLLTGKIDSPPEWAAENSIGLLGAIQTNVHHHAHDAMRWMRLSDIFLAFEATEQAMEAQARAYRLSPENEEVAVRYAQTQFFASGGMLTPDSRKALYSVLKTNPNHQGAQMLMAMGEARAGNYEQAQAWITKLRDEIQSRDGDHSEALQSLNKLTENIQAQQQASSVEQSAPKASTADVNIAVSVKINPSLVPMVESSDILYVTVRESAGGPPLAAKRLPASDLTRAVDGFNIELTDSDAMMPSRTISQAMEQDKDLVVSARVSKSGQAITESGDLSADDVPVNYKDSDSQQMTVAIEINQQVP